MKSTVNTPHKEKWLKLTLAAVLTLNSSFIMAAEKVNLSMLSWPGYGFWFIAKEKNLAPELDINISIIEDPYESYSLMTAGKLDVTSSSVEYGPIAADIGVPIKLVTYTNPSYGTDKIILAPGVKSATDLIGKKVAVMEGGLPQIYVGIWLDKNGVNFDQVEYVNVIMDEAVGAMIGGNVSGGAFWEPFGENVIKNLPGSTVVAESSQPEWISEAILADGIYMNENFIAQRPKAAKLMIEAYFKAVDWWKKHPEEGNKIIAKGIHFTVSDVEMVLGKTGDAHKGGLMVFDKTQAAQFMGLLPGNPPLGMKNGQIKTNWNTMSDWWKKFGFVQKTYDWQAGVDTAPLKAALESK